MEDDMKVLHSGPYHMSYLSMSCLTHSSPCPVFLHLWDHRCTCVSIEKVGPFLQQVPGIPYRTTLPHVRWKKMICFKVPFRPSFTPFSDTPSPRPKLIVFLSKKKSQVSKNRGTDEKCLHLVCVEGHQTYVSLVKRLPYHPTVCHVSGNWVRCFFCTWPKYIVDQGGGWPLVQTVTKHSTSDVLTHDWRAVASELTGCLP
jgi:hypothetical protein